ncbi:unnamed protein product [Taenia asiatica]|uniref:Uncharacterized protein n=1 Tax=Taenia asiatica TaxID=60517 RepID=A0A0R3W2H8_TAEAS|nr:unnamed protein product [Taenia asiatica]
MAGKSVQQETALLHSKAMFCLNDVKICKHVYAKCNDAH